MTRARPARPPRPCSSTRNWRRACRTDSSTRTWNPAADGRKDAAGIAGGFLEALGIAADRIPNDPGQRIGLYRSLLHRRRLLVVLDGVTHERQVRELLTAAPESRILITSRSRLLGLDGIGRIKLPSLDRDESMELLAELLGEGRREAGRFLSRLQIGDEGLGSRLDSAYRLLTPWARLMLRQFAVCGNPPSVDNVVYGSTDAPAVLVERSAQPVEDLLEGLLDAVLLEPSDLSGQYGLTPMARAFALAQPDPTEEEQAPAARSETLARVAR
ncbi:hypothetical protein [Streptomyces sp. NPDC041003]|uniref:hypothetical protein n=1 Tax=Streptomyces sp. NPDC041003 TaxID=3155730 RepID=UPI003405C876